MKRLALLFLFLLLCSSLLCIPVSAVDEEPYFSDFLDTLPSELREALEGKESTEEVGELLGVEHLFSMLVSAIGDGIAASLPFFLRLVGICVLLSLLSQLAASLSPSSCAAAEACIGIVLVFLVFRLAEADISRATACLRDLSDISNGMIPIFFGLFAAGGSTATATASAAGFTAFSYLIKSVCIGVLLPILRLLFAFSAIRAAGGRLKTEGLFASLRSTYITVLAFLSVLLVTSLGFQSSLSASADSLATQSVRFTVGQLIPVIGTSLSGSLRTIAASLSLVKGTLGTLAVVALLLLLLPPLVELLLHRFLLSLCASVSAMLGSERAKETLIAFRGVYDLAAATVAICMVLFILMLSLLLRCGIAISPA